MSTLIGSCQRAENGTLDEVASALRQIARKDASIRAWAHIGEEVHLRRPTPEAAGALVGRPFGVKDVIDVAGMPTRCGSAAYRSSPVQFDAACVAQLRRAGAVPIGKTTTTELAHVQPAATRNPVAYQHTPGGSSSGSAAAVAAQMVPIALGTQTGGSIVRPAAFCGTIGFKPTFGLVPRDGMKVMCESLDVIGWFAATVQDALDVAAVLLPAAHRIENKPLDGLSVAFLAEHPGYSQDRHVADALQHARSVLSENGARVERARDRLPAQCLLDAHSTLMHFEFARTALPIMQEHAAGLSDKVLATVAKGLTVASDAYLTARHLQRVHHNGWADWFGEADLLLTSSTLGCAPKGLAFTGESGFNKGWSVLGWPCLHLPTCSVAGLPLGVLLVGRPGSDLFLLRSALALHPLLLTSRH